MCVYYWFLFSMMNIYGENVLDLFDDSFDDQNPSLFL